MARHFFRCTDCLAVCAIDDPAFQYGTLTAATCGACTSTTFDHMGRVHMDRLVTVETACACDERCTCARGPLCSCSCGGKNHGKGLGCTVTITTDRGAVPTITPGRHRGKLAAIGAEFRDMLDRALQQLDRLHTKKRAAYLSDDEYRLFVDTRNALVKARKLRVHAARVKAFDAIGIRPTSAAPVDIDARTEPIGPMATTQQGLF